MADTRPASGSADAAERLHPPLHGHGRVRRRREARSSGTRSSARSSLVCIASIVFRGFNFGIDFTGGTQIQFPAAGAGAPATAEDVRAVYEQAVGQEPAAVQTVGQGTGRRC